MTDQTANSEATRLKTDALWLSKEADIDELSSLRTVIIDWQHRANNDLLHNWYGSEISGVQLLTTAASNNILSETVSRNGGVRNEATDDDDESKHRRLFQLLCAEKRYMYKSAELIVGMAQRAELQNSRLRYQDSWPEVRIAAEDLCQTQNSSAFTKGLAGFSLLHHLINVLDTLFITVAESQNWPNIVQADQSLAEIYVASHRSQAISVLRLIHLNLMTYRLSASSAKDVKLWYDFLDKHSFLADFAAVEADEMIVVINGLVAFISVEILRIGPVISIIQDTSDKTIKKSGDDAYIYEEDCLRLVSSCLLGAVSQNIPACGPAALVWSLIGQAMRFSFQSSQDGRDDFSRSTSSDHVRTSGFEPLVNVILAVLPSDDAIAILGNAAVNNLQVFDFLPSVLNTLTNLLGSPTDIHSVICTKITALDVAKYAMAVVSYGPEIVQTVLASLSYDRQDSPSIWPAQPAQKLKEDQEILGSDFMAKVVARYPLELDSFLFCLKAVSRSEAYNGQEGPQIVQLLENLTTFTSVLPKGFDEYELVQDDNMTNCIQITRPLSIFVPLHSNHSVASKDLILANSDTKYTIPAGSIGVVLNDTRPLVVSWQFTHSGLEYLGGLLSTISPNSALADARVEAELTVDSAGDIIALMTSLLVGSSLSEDQDAGKNVLAKISKGLTRNDDIVRVIFDIFEDQLQHHSTQKGTEGSIALLCECVNFIKATLEIYPERTWSTLSRSKLLPIDAFPGSVPAIVGMTEIPCNQYRFLETCLSLYESLVHNCTRSAVSRNSTSESRALTRFEQKSVSSSRTPEKLMSTLLFNFGRIVADTVLSQANWRFDDMLQRYRIIESALRSSNQILRSHFGLASKGLLSTYAASANYVMTTFTHNASSDSSSQAVSDIMIRCLSNLTGPLCDNHEIVSACLELVDFCTLLVRVSFLNSHNPMQKFVTHLSQLLPLLVRIWAIHPTLKSSVATLLTAIVQSFPEQEGQSTSLLAHLAPQTAKSFVSLLSNIDTPLNSIESESVMWELLSAIISKQQRWLAISILTGSTPRDRLKPDTKLQQRSLIDVTLTKLSTISALSPRRLVAMLTFLAAAQDHWSWVSTSIGEHPSVIKAMSQWCFELSPNIRKADTEACIRNAHENQVAALIANILARYLHNTRNSDNLEKIVDMLNKLAYFRENVTSFSSYNPSLHNSLARNFDQKFFGCSLESFRRSTLLPSEYGTKYYYDLDLADKTLGFDQSWRRTKGQGFYDEVARANINYSVVDSEIALLKSWECLALEIANQSIQDQRVQKDMIKIVESCLRSNLEANEPSDILERIYSTRINFAFALLQKLSKTGASSAEFKDILQVAWDLVRTSGLDFEMVERQQDVEKYRILLQILFLSLQPHVTTTTTSTSSSYKSLSKSADTTPAVLSTLTSTLLEIVTKVVASNFRALCTSVHATQDKERLLLRPADFVLITAILQSILRIPCISTVQRQIANIIAESNLIRYAISLYSWSDSLDARDLVYAELSMLFLLTLSTVSLSAEQMAVDGVLSSISSANISNTFRDTSSSSQSSSSSIPSSLKKGGQGPLDKPYRSHSIWTRGILPLCLNILSAVGPGIAGEVSHFLLSFSQQIKRSEDELAMSLHGPAVTLSSSTNITHPSSSTSHLKGSLNLPLAKEIHSLVLIAGVLTSFKSQGAMVGVNSADISLFPPDVFDVKTVGDVVKGLIRNLSVVSGGESGGDMLGLRSRIVPIGEREMGLWKTRSDGKEKGSDSSGGRSLLEEMILVELKGVIECLGGKHVEG